MLSIERIINHICCQLKIFQKIFLNFKSQASEHITSISESASITCRIGVQYVIFSCCLSTWLVMFYLFLKSKWKQNVKKTFLRALTSWLILDVDHVLIFGYQMEWLAFSQTNGNWVVKREVGKWKNHIWEISLFLFTCIHLPWVLSSRRELSTS